MRKGLRLLLVILIGLLFSSSAMAAVVGDFISTPSEENSPAFHQHLVKPGTMTTYIIRVSNPGKDPVEINLELIVPSSDSWSASLSETRVSGLNPGAYKNVLLTIKPKSSVKPGEIFKVEVGANSSAGFQDSLKVIAQASNTRKIYYVSIDSLDPRYLNLNAKGAGPGKEGDWLMPNLHRLMKRAVFYPNANCHIITATDMNHYNILAGTMTGTSGISLVGAFVFGVDDKGNFIIKSAATLDSNIARYGPDGKYVPSLYNASKNSNPQAWNAFVSGKNWVPELYRFPEFQIDRIIHGARPADWVIAPDSKPRLNDEYYENTLKPLAPGAVLYEKHSMGNPAGVKETPDPRYNSLFALLTGMVPDFFPPDRWVMDSAILEVLNEDPDLAYILLAVVDDAGHAFGSAFDLAEWDTRGTETLADDVSKYDSRASRQGILNVVRDADDQVGRFLDFLQQRGTLDDSIIVLESDHGMITYFRKSLDLKDPLKKVSGYQMKVDYGHGSAADIGMIGAIKNDPKMLKEIESALENWTVTNPVTGGEERPILVFNREEMKTGFDQSSGKQWMLPKEYYSEYYIERRKEGEQMWPDLLILTMPHYKFKVQNFGLGNLGLTKVPIKLPEAGYFIGGHGSFETRPILLMMQVPGVKPGVVDQKVYTMDVAPTIYQVQGWKIPEVVDGKPLPGIELK